ncbi:SDR family NAD(P)-dependent oxidoreductase [Tomitella biformata]|uniref:SDR family NAD(P)-dependent oxidoreductase n=1 Tax=Tomitella biformata TaxID=630403 RepID=UPI00046720E3|nr:SDR family oxidoreductase [Tomitella biformata]
MTINSALVIGGGGGIGAAVSRKLAASHAVAVGYRDRQDRARAVVQEIQDAGGSALAVGSDVRTAAGVDQAFHAAEELGPLRTVVHCAGAWDYTRVSDLTEESIDADYQTNLRSGLLTLAAAANRVADNGRIVMISSAAAYMAPGRQASYAAMKAGLEAASRSTAKELGRRGITVNVVRPGATDTERLRTSTAEKAVEAMSAAPALRRLGTPEDIAEAVDWLASEKARWVTGTVLDATGGLW